MTEDPLPTVFVDTAGWYALVDQSDQEHDRARRWFSENRSPLMTTDYVLDETLTLLRRRLGHPTAVTFGNRLFHSEFARVIPVEDPDRKKAWEIFRQHKDETFSFTDCTCFSVMSRRNIKKAFTFDNDFAIAGYRPVPD